MDNINRFFPVKLPQLKRNMKIKNCRMINSEMKLIKHYDQTEKSVNFIRPDTKLNNNHYYKNIIPAEYLALGFFSLLAVAANF